MNFEQAIERLEEISQLLGSGDTPLEQSLELFKEATALLAGCNERLNNARLVVEECAAAEKGDQ